MKKTLILAIIPVVLLSGCVKNHCKSKSTFYSHLNGQEWSAVPGDCYSQDDDYSIVVVENSAIDGVPDRLNFFDFPRETGEKVFNSIEDVKTRPYAVFTVLEESDVVADWYRIVPDGQSWIRISTIDVETNEWTIEFELKMSVDREEGPKNVTYGDTIVFSQGMMKAVFRRG